MFQKIFALSFLLLFLLQTGQEIAAQEINATVTVEHRQIQGTNVSVFKTLESSLTEFVNNRRWTDQDYLASERIDCNFILNLESNEGSRYSGTLTVSARRPVYNAAFNTTLINLVDKKIKFNYNEYDQLVLNINSLTQDLTAVVGFYVYVILGLDADSFARLGGDTYYNTAISIVNTAQSSNVLSEDGWDRLDKDPNRHTLISELISPEFRLLREYMYSYHRQGLDLMVENVNRGANVIIDGLSTLEKVYDDHPASYVMLLFFDVKYLEISNIIKNLDMDDARKKKTVELLKRLDPSRVKAYNSL